MIDELANDYTAYLKINLTKELAPVEETIEDMLTRLDEFESLVDMVRSDGSHSLGDSAAEMLLCKSGLESLCQRIDSLESFVSRVKRDLDVLETHMDAAESEVGTSDGTLKNIFKPLFYKKSDAAKSMKSPTYEAPELFNTSDFFKCEEEETKD